MFDNLRRAFREAVDNFKEELDRDDVPEAVDNLLRAMKREAADTQAETQRLEAAIKKAIAATETEKREGETCRRREKMASEIGDEETARVAREYAEKHEHRREVHEQKALVLREELNMRRGEFKEMIATIKESEKNRDTLTATAGRATARNSIDGAEDLFAELDQIAGDIKDDDAQRDAQMEVNDAMDDDPLDEFRSAPEPPPINVDARLEALKRAMGRDDQD
jgi:phage shock protein A